MRTEFMMNKRMKRFGLHAVVGVFTSVIVAGLWVGAGESEARGMGGREVAAIHMGLQGAVAREDGAKAEEPKWEQVEEEWSVLELAGKKAGHVVSRLWKSGDLFRTDSIMKMTLGRVGESASIEFQTSYVETSAGKAVSITSVQKTSTQPVRMTATFGEKMVEVVTEEGGKETRRSEPLPTEKWLTPRGVEQMMKEKVKSEEKEYSYATIDPSNSLKPAHIHGTFKEKKRIESGGKEVEVSAWEGMSDLMPVKTTEYYDAEGEMVEQRIGLGIGEMVTRRTTKEEALAKGDGGAAEVLLPSFVKPDKPLPNEQRATHLTLRVKTKDGQAINLPSAGGQSVEKTENTAEELVRVNTEEGSEATKEEQENQAYRKASGPISSDDELVKKLAESAVRKVAEENGEKSDLAKAEAMRLRVYKHISKKDMGTAFASAAETAKTRTGDCSEHAVLLCAMLRSQGIAARVATGLLHVDDGSATGFYGWHMWTQALIEGKWLDFDATLDAKQRYNVGHILTAVSSLADDAPATDLSSVLSLLGNLEIKVEESVPTP